MLFIKTNYEKWKSDLENLKKEKSEQNYKELKDSIQKFQQQNRVQLNTVENRINLLKTILLKNSDSKELHSKVHEKIDPLLDEIRTTKESIQQLQKDLIEIGKTFESKEDDEIPEEFMDPMMDEIMQDPVFGSDGHTYDRSTAVKLEFSPYTRAPFTIIKEREILDKKSKNIKSHAES